MSSIESAYIDYRDLSRSLDNGDASKDTIYEQIMSKEQNRIDLINRVVDQKNEKDMSTSFFYNKSLIDVCMLFASTWRNIFYQLVVEKNYKDSKLILYDGDRKIYSGMMLVLIALFLFFVNISG